MGGLHAYFHSLVIVRNDPLFDAIIMAAIRKADTGNLMMLGYMWPELVAEFKERYNAPGGILEGDDVKDVGAVMESKDEIIKKYKRGGN